MQGHIEIHEERGTTITTWMLRRARCDSLGDPDGYRDCDLN
jgi:hypothetical protein